MYSYQLMNYSGMLGRTPVKVGAARRLAKGEAASIASCAFEPNSISPEALGARGDLQRLAQKQDRKGELERKCGAMVNWKVRNLIMFKLQTGSRSAPGRESRSVYLLQVCKGQLENGHS